jgi:hypothetical protein
MAEFGDYNDDPATAELNIYRADGRMICSICGKEYWRHPLDQLIIGSDGPYLRLLCNSDRVKL